MSNRSANSSILGFEYQLVESLYVILDKQIKGTDESVIIEGIEDLDSIGPNVTEFYQYKYYHETRVSASTFQKATAYLFCHWKRHQNENFRYKLFINAKNLLKTPNVLELSHIFSLKYAEQILRQEQKDGSFQNDVLYTEDELQAFLTRYEVKMVPAYDEVIVNIQEQIHNIFGVENELAEKLYLPLLLTKIHNIAVQKSVTDRTISVTKFIQSFKADSKKIDKIIRFHYKKIDETIKSLIQYLKNTYSFQRRRYSLVLQFGKSWDQDDLISLISFLAPSFVSKDVRTDNLPLTFAIDLDSSEMIQFKKKLAAESINQGVNYLFNDGYETFCFSIPIFSCPPIFNKSRSNTKYSDSISFNYRICMLDNCNRVLLNSALSDPFVFCFDIEFNKGVNNVPYLQLDKFDKEAVQALIGGLAK